MSRQIPPCPLMLAHLCCMQLLAIGVQPAFMRLGCSLAVIASLLLGGCTGLPANTDRVTSHASNDTGSTRLAIIAQASLPGVDRLQSGLRLLPDGRQALEARLSLAAAAESSIDAQYYQIETDRSGLCFLASLRAAALRGVRVRLLVDDLHASGQDELLSGLARAGMEVRMFNPLPVRTGSTGSRILWSLHEFSRINRRMHNKLFIVDGAFAISGGRNIADDYFGRGPTSSFVDLDVLSAGMAVRAMSKVFDDFWNSDASFPIQTLSSSFSARKLPSPAAEMYDAQTVPLQDALGQGPVGVQLAEGRVALEVAATQVVADPPDRVPLAPVSTSVVRMNHLELMYAARSDILIASPYFLPDEEVNDSLKEAIRRNVLVSVVTNSRSTTDVPLIHVCYARHRRALLDVGVRIFELMPRPGALMGGSATGSLRSSLHAKIATFDGRWVSIGSMNMDARSAKINTEMTVIVDSPYLARQISELVTHGSYLSAYEVSASPVRGELQWTFLQERVSVILRAEPQGSWGSQLPTALVSALVSESQL